MKKWLEIFAVFTFAAAVVVCAVVGYNLMTENRGVREEVKKLKENVDIVVKYDSIISAREKVLLDSIKAVRESLEQTKKFQHDENRKLRARNEALEKRFRDLDLSDRPNF